MQHDNSSPAAYLASLPDDWRGALVRKLDERLQARGLLPGIGYKMLSYADTEGAVLHLNAQAHHVGLYVGLVDGLDPDGMLLAGIDCGKGCIRLKKRDAQAIGRIEAVVDRVLELRRAGIETGC